MGPYPAVCVATLGVFNGIYEGKALSVTREGDSKVPTLENCNKIRVGGAGEDDGENPYLVY